MYHFDVDKNVLVVTAQCQCSGDVDLETDTLPCSSLASNNVLLPEIATTTLATTGRNIFREQRSGVEHLIRLIEFATLWNDGLAWKLLLQYIAFNAARIILPWLLPLTSLELRYCHMYKRISGGVIFLLCAGFLISFLVWQPMLPETTFNELKIISRLSATDLFIIFRAFA